VVGSLVDLPPGSNGMIGRKGRALNSGATLLVVLALGVAGPLEAGRKPARVPLEDRLTYRISWLGVHCGELTLESAPVEGRPGLVRILMTVRSSELFDSVYRVRAEMESLYNTFRGTTRRYHEVSTEQDKTKDDLWLVDHLNRKAKRTLNGKQEIYELPDGGSVLDPLALVYRIRALAKRPGDLIVLTAMTTEGSLRVHGRVERWERFETPQGEVTALKVVQEAVGDSDLARGGGMTLWLANDQRRTPYRIDFDLPFGRLVARLVPEAPEGEEAAPGEGASADVTADMIAALARAEDDGEERR